MVRRYEIMLEPLNMYVENLQTMLHFQQGRFFGISGIRCDYENRNKKKREEACRHVACPRCWHRATRAALCAIHQAGNPPGLRLRIVNDVPPALDHLAFVRELTAGEIPWVYDSRCESQNPDVRHLVVLSAIPDPPKPDQDTAVLCGSEEVPLAVKDFSTVESALDAWFVEAPPPFTYPDYEQFVRTTMLYTFGESIHVFEIPPGYVTSPSVDDSLKNL
jgi:hypothetical protein